MVYHRAQILLDPEQYARIRQIARSRGKSISEIVREIVNIGLNHFDRVRNHRLRMLDDLEQLGASLEKSTGPIPGDIVQQIRDHRDEQLLKFMAAEK